MVHMGFSRMQVSDDDTDDGVEHEFGGGNSIFLTADWASNPALMVVLNNRSSSRPGIWSRR